MTRARSHHVLALLLALLLPAAPLGADYQAGLDAYLAGDFDTPSASGRPWSRARPVP